MPEKQKVWKSMYSVPNCGYFVWEIMEADAENNPFKGSLIECRDGSYILVLPPWHYWTKERAMDALFSREEYFESYVISGHPELTRQEYREFLELED